MIDLNNLEEIKKLDPKDVYGSTELLPSQCEQIWNESKNIEFSLDYKSAQNVIVCGMGGSAYGGYVAQALLKNTLKVPIFSNNDYNLPAYASKNSLIVLSSYSGSTEETLSCAQEAYSKNFNVTGITGGGKLKELLQSHSNIHILFNPKYNPSGQPRLGTGYMVLGFICLLTRLGFIQIDNEIVLTAISELKNSEENIKSKAISAAQEIYGNIPLIFSSEFLNGNAHIIRNQFNETSKTLSIYEDIPELNHHLMEGLKNPQNKKITALFLNSEFYSDKHKKRIIVTRDVLEQNGVKSFEYKPSGTSQLSQMLSVLSFGGYVTFYLGILYGQDPSLIPWVDYFKEKLASE